MAKTIIPRFLAGIVTGAVSASAPIMAQTSTESGALERAETIETCLRDAGSFSIPTLRRCASIRPCRATAVVSRPIRLHWHDGEAHPAWSTNDRARLTDLGSLRINRAVDQHPATHRATANATPSDTLTVETLFSGMDSLHRDISDWVQAPRMVTITIRLQRTETDEVIGTHKIEARIPAGIQPYQRDTSAAAWLQKSLDELRNGTTNLLDTYYCEPTIFKLVKTRNGQPALDLRDLQGVPAGLQVVLIPTIGRETPEPYAIARVTAVESGLSATLEAVNGDVRNCANGDCVAVAL